MHLDADKVVFPLRLRNVRTGDAFVPYGMKGRKLISDYLTDRKLSLFDKQRQLVVEDAEGTIVWLVSQRTSNLCAVTEETKTILEITIK